MARTTLADYGLIMKGMGDAQYETDARREDIASRQQTARLRGQQEQVSAMGLEDARRARSVDEAVRAAGSRAAVTDAARQSQFGDAARAATAGTDLGEGVQGPPAPLKGRLAGLQPSVPIGQAGTIEAMAAAADEAGDPLRAMQLRNQKRKLMDEGIADVIGAVMRNDSVGQRPDLAQVWNQKGAHAVLPDKTVLEIDPKSGDRILSSVHATTGEPVSMPIGKTAAALGLVKKPETQVLKNDERLVSKDTGATVAGATADPGKFHMADGILYNDRTGRYQQVGQGDWKLGNITNGNMEVPVAINGKTGEVAQLGPGGARSGMQAHVTFPPTGGNPLITLPGGQVSEFKPATEAVPPRSGLFSSDPGKPGQSARLEPVGGGEQPPIQGAQKAPDGKWYVRNGDKWAEVIVGGSAGIPPATPAAAPSRPDDNLRHEPVPTDTGEALPKLVDEPAPGGTGGTSARREANAARRTERVGKAVEGVKKVGKALLPDDATRAVSGYRALIKQGSYTRASASIIEDAISTGQLTPAEQRTAEAMLAQIRPQTANQAASQ